MYRLLNTENNITIKEATYKKWLKTFKTEEIYKTSFSAYSNMYKHL